MSENTPSQADPSAEKAFAEALESSLAELRREVDERFEQSRSALNELLAGLAARLPTPPEPVPPVPTPEPSARETGFDAGVLRDALRELDGADSQAELMARLVEQAAAFCERTVLLLAEDGGRLRSWASLGFGRAGTRLEGLELPRFDDATWRAACHRAQRLDPATCRHLTDFVEVEVPGSGALVPLTARGQTLALLYADGGEDGRVDFETLQILTHVAAQELELLPLQLDVSPALLEGLDGIVASEETAESTETVEETASETDEAAPAPELADVELGSAVPEAATASESSPVEIESPPSPAEPPAAIVEATQSVDLDETAEDPSVAEVADRAPDSAARLDDTLTQIPTTEPIGDAEPSLEPSTDEAPLELIDETEDGGIELDSPQEVEPISPADQGPWPAVNLTEPASDEPAAHLLDPAAGEDTPAPPPAASPFDQLADASDDTPGALEMIEPEVPEAPGLGPELTPAEERAGFVLEELPVEPSATAEEDDEAAPEAQPTTSPEPETPPLAASVPTPPPAAPPPPVPEPPQVTPAVPEPPQAEPAVPEPPPAAPETAAPAPSADADEPPPATAKPAAGFRTPTPNDPSSLATQAIRPSDLPQMVAPQPPPAPPEPPKAEPPAAPPAGGTSSGAQVQPPEDFDGPGAAFLGSSAGAGADQPLHDEAKRLARLLVSELKLYNEDQIETGRRQGNIYSALRDDIDRSRQMYEERVDQRVRESTDYFRDELVRTLADGDGQILGL